MKITKKQVALVLDAIASLEGWDSHHPTIANSPLGSWSRLQLSDRASAPAPSDALMREIKNILGNL